MCGAGAFRWWASGAKDLSKGFAPKSALLKAVMINSAATNTLDYWFKGADGAWEWYDTTGQPETGAGFGNVDLSAVLWFGPAESPGRGLVAVNDDAVEHGVYRQYCVQVSGSMRATVVWTDPPGFPGSTKNLINDLDLIVVAPDGTQLLGNSFGNAGVTADRVNNVEHVSVSGSGLYKVRVGGADVPYYTQSFSLVIAGEIVREVRARPWALLLPFAAVCMCLWVCQARRAFLSVCAVLRF